MIEKKNNRVAVKKLSSGRYSPPRYESFRHLPTQRHTQPQRFAVSKTPGILPTARRPQPSTHRSGGDNEAMFSASRHFKTIAQTALCLAILGSPMLSSSQTAPTPPKTGLILPAGASAKKADEFLSTLRPPTSIQTLESGNDLLLDFPAIAAAGPIRFKAVSTMPRTDGMWLLSLSPQPESGSALFASITLEPSALPEATLLFNLGKTQPILLVVRAAGKYYGLQREIKVGLPVSASITK